MTSRLTTRSDTPTALQTDRNTTWVKLTHPTARIKAAGKPRSEHIPNRTASRAAKPAEVSMDYQQGFTSGPSV